MSDPRASERLRQERETFDAIKREDRSWFQLRLIMGYACIALLFGIAAVSSAIILTPDNHAREIVAMAGTALLIEVLGLVVWIGKTAFTAGATSRLRPMTRERRR